MTLSDISIEEIYNRRIRSNGPIKGVFDRYIDDVYPIRYDVELLVYELHGGIPANPKTAEGWIRARLEGGNEGLVQDLVRETVLRRLGIDPDDENAEVPAPEELGKLTTSADIEKAVETMKVNGFYRMPDGRLALRRRHVQAMLKEAVNVAWPKRSWGPTRKGTKSYWPEHVFVVEDWIPMDRTEPDSIEQGFIHKWTGSSMKYEEVLYDVTVPFTVLTDLELKQSEWAELWLRAQHLGLGASRSQGVGEFTVKKWQKA